MRTQPSPAAAANDVRFLQPVKASASNIPGVASTPFTPVQVAHFCRPLCHVKRCTTALPFPVHFALEKRISQEAWRQLNADLLVAMYHETPYCNWARKGIKVLHTFNLQNHRALYKVIAHYNRHLFHPMLIDAQIFADHDTTGSKTWFLVMLA
jgi:hypothetical protein